MKKMLYVGHSYHQKTQSVSFILDIFKKQYEITFLSVEMSRGPNDGILQTIVEDLTPLQGSHFDLLVCLQVMPSIDHLKTIISFDHGVFIPMADFYYIAQQTCHQKIWWEYKDFQIISFSRKVHDELRQNGFSSHYFQYFPEPSEKFIPGDSTAVFMWQRITELNLLVLLKLFANFNLTWVHVHRALDPGEGYTPLSYQQQGKLRMTFSSWFKEKRSMLELVDKCAFYFGSRKCEGIGLSYLEAMARGRCVIAPDETTFNEYITHGKTGFLFPINSPQGYVSLENVPTSKEEIRKIQKQTYDYMVAGYKQWCNCRNKMLSVAVMPPDNDPVLQRKAIAKAEAVPAQPCPAVTAPGNSFVTSLIRKVKKSFLLSSGKLPGHHLIGIKRFMGIPFYTKVARDDRKMVYIFLLGIPLLTVEFR